MWEDLPLGESSYVRTSEWPAPVRWHNATGRRGMRQNDDGVLEFLDDMQLGDGRIGKDFCWESREGERVLDLEDGVVKSQTGMSETMLQQQLLGGGDAVFESGGLDFLFPRALMALWLGDSLSLGEREPKPLTALTCLPFTRNGSLLRARCGKGSDNLLLLCGY